MKKQIEITEEQVRDFYKDLEGFKRILEANFSKEELIKKQLPKSWEELNAVKGWLPDIFTGEIRSTSGKYTTRNTSNKVIFAIESQARSALAKAQLSQLMKAYNGDWEADWNDTKQKKLTIRRERNYLMVDSGYYVFQFLAFPTEELRDEFFTNFETLIKEYFEL